MKILFIVFSITLLVYMLWPGQNSISQFPPLPSSEKSTLEGDTIQITNVSAYFSDNFREFVVPFYSTTYQKLTNLPFPPLKLNHPPEYSWIAIKRHTDSTYIEELIYPLRDSLYVNGFEPLNSEYMPKWWGASKFEVGGKQYFTKTTLRFYPSPVWVRIFVWFGIVLALLFVLKLGKKILRLNYEK